jgi:hypothetical protein
LQVFPLTARSPPSLKPRCRQLARRAITRIAKDSAVVLGFLAISLASSLRLQLAVSDGTDFVACRSNCGYQNVMGRGLAGWLAGWPVKPCPVSLTPAGDSAHPQPSSLDPVCSCVLSWLSYRSRVDAATHLDDHHLDDGCVGPLSGI